MQHFDAEIDGLRLHAVESRADGPLVLMLHNNSGGAETFARLLMHEQLRAFRLVALDFPGHGHSSRAAAARYGLPALAACLERFIAGLSADRFAIVGHSLGGHIATSVAERLPSLRALLLVSAPPLPRERLGDVFKPDPTNGLLFRAQLSKRDLVSFAETLLGPGEPRDGAVEWLGQVIAATDPAFREALGASVALGELCDERQIVARLQVPVLAVFGSEDPFHDTSYYQTLEFGNRASAVVPIVGAGHCPHVTDPDRFVQAIRGALSDALLT